MLHMRLGEAQPAAAGHHGVSLKTVGKAARTRAREAASEQGGWAIPVLRTNAQSGDGIDELRATLDRHSVYLSESGELSRRRRRRLGERVRGVVDREMKRVAWERGPGEGMLAESLDALESGDESPYSVAARIVRALGVGEGG